MLITALFAKTPMRHVQAVLLEQREEESKQRDAGEASDIDDTRVRQAIAYSREDIAGLVFLSGFALGELRAIRWILTAILLVLLVRTFL